MGLAVSRESCSGHTPDDSPRIVIDKGFRPAVIPPQVLDSDLTTHERMAIGVIVSHGERAYPSHRRIARGMGCCVTAARRALKGLQDKGWFTIEHRSAISGGQTSNLYHLHYPIPPIAREQGGVSKNHPPCPQRTTNILKKSEVREEEKNGAPQTEPPVSLSPNSPKTPDEWRRSTEAVDRLLDLFAELCQKALGHSPPREWGRDRKMVGKLVKQYGEQNADIIIREFVAYRAREGKVITIPALAGAAEAVYQRSSAGRSRKPVREHPEMRRQRKWDDYVRQQRKGDSVGVSGDAPGDGDP